MLDLYKNIKKRRKELHMTQEELALKVGYTNRSTIATIESGKIDLPQSKIKQIAEALDLTPIELMGLDEWSENLIKVQNPMLRAGFKIKEPRKRKSDSELLRYVAEMSDDVSSAAVGEVVISPNRRRLSEAVQGMSEEQLEQIIKYAEFIKSQS